MQPFSPHGLRMQLSRLWKPQVRLLVLFVIPVGICLLGLTYSLCPAWTPIDDIATYARFSDNYAILSLQVTSEGQSLDSLTVDYEIHYYVLLGESVPVRFTMITTGPEPTAGIGIPLESQHHVGPTYFSLRNGTDLVYDTWVYGGTMTVFVSSRQIEWFPYDVYLSQKIYVWFNSTVYPRVALESAPPSGFDLSLYNLGTATKNATWNEMSLGHRLFAGYPDMDPLVFQLSTYRNYTQRLYLASFSYAVNLVVVWVPVLTYLSGMELKDRIRIIPGMAMAVVAFLWAMTAVVRSITYVEAFAIVVLTGWTALEVVAAIRRPPTKQVRARLAFRRASREPRTARGRRG